MIEDVQNSPIPNIPMKPHQECYKHHSPNKIPQWRTGFKGSKFSRWEIPCIPGVLRSLLDKRFFNWATNILKVWGLRRKQGPAKGWILWMILKDKQGFSTNMCHSSVWYNTWSRIWNFDPANSSKLTHPLKYPPTHPIFTHNTGIMCFFTPPHQEFLENQDTLGDPGRPQARALKFPSPDDPFLAIESEASSQHLRCHWRIAIILPTSGLVEEVFVGGSLDIICHHLIRSLED